MQKSYQLDEISKAIGNFESYAQEFRKGSNNLMDLIKANEKLSCERDAALKTDMHTKFDKEILDLSKQIDSMSTRLMFIEEARMRAQGIANLGSWFVKNWPLAGMVSALAGFVAWANGKLF